MIKAMKFIHGKVTPRIAAGVACILIAVGLLYFFLLKDLPSPTTLSSTELPQSTQIYDRNATLLYTIYGNKNQTFVPLADMPINLQKATIAIEDKDFYHHGAVDFRGIARAFYSTVFHKQVQGGSTLTQQLVKNGLLTQEQTLPRKIKEIILAQATEILYPKNKILEMYLNQSPYGGTAWGAEAASQMYFGKHVKDLDLAQAAMLAGLPESPSVLSPFGSHPEWGKERQEVVLDSMAAQGYITKDQAQKAKKEELHFKQLSNDIKAPHFVFYIKQLLVEKYGEQTVEEGGLVVRTSLDLKTQDMAQDIVASEVEKDKRYNVSNGSALITNPATGEILAMVGSRDYFDSAHDGNVNVTIAHRQPGSSIKPINYAVGLIKGYTAATPFIDKPTCYPAQGSQYCPVNYDGKWHGVTQMRWALGNSFNIPAVKMLKVNTLPTFIATASAMGITTFTDPNRYGLSLTLGGGEVTMTDMATAFGVFANGGYRVDLHPILKVTNSSGKVLEEYNPPGSPIFGKKVIPPGVAFIISQMLSDNNARTTAFGPNSELRIPGKVVAVKTGTTNDYRDNWTIGYTPSVLVATWVGNNDNSAMNGLTSGVTGAAPMWHDLMTAMLKNIRSGGFQKPDDVVGSYVCSDSGLPPQAEGTPGRCATRFEYFIKGTIPRQTDPGIENVLIDKSTNDLAKPGQTDNAEYRPMRIVKDPTGDTYCVTCAHPEPTPKP